MDMIIKLLIPDMEDLYDPWSRPEIFFISRQFQKGFGTASVKQAVEELLVTVNGRVQFMGKSKFRMKIGGINDFSPAIIHPEFL